jgi:putative transposase
MEQQRTIVAECTPTAGSERRACRWLGFHRSAVRYTPHRPDEQALRQRLRELAEEHPRWGSPRLIWRLYRLEGLAVRRRRRKRVAMPRVVMPTPTQPNERWSMDFVRDRLSDGRPFRALTLVDDCTRECPVIEVDLSLGSVRVVAVLERLAVTRGLPHTIVVDNGPEFQSRALDAWAHHRHVQLQFIHPGKPVENAFIESFNGKLRDECLNQHWFLSLADARRTIEAWRLSYNTARPHRALGTLTPSQFALQFQAVQTTQLSA